MRRGKLSTGSQNNDIEALKEKRSSEILKSIATARQKSFDEAEKEVKNLVAAWQEQGIL